MQKELKREKEVGEEGYNKIEVEWGQKLKLEDKWYERRIRRKESEEEWLKKQNDTYYRVMHEKEDRLMVIKILGLWLSQ